MYYPAPFLSPPSLDVTPVDGKGMIMHLEQKEDRLVVTALSLDHAGQQGVALKWKAADSSVKIARQREYGNTGGPLPRPPVTAK